jgi:acetyl esterase/lipase
MKIFPRSHFFVRLIPAVVVGALMFGWPVRADELRRVALDGVTPVPAPVEKICNDGTIAIHQVSQPALELFPTRQQPARGTILVCPGGGYGLLAISKEGRDVAKKLNDFGYDAAVLLYHVNAGKATRELAMNDAQTAFRLLQQRGAKLGLNSQRIGVMGFSAGGHLVARLTHAVATNAPPAFIVLMYPAYLEKNGRVLDEVAPVKTPAFVYVANDDPYALSAKAYAAACQAAHVPCAYYLKPHGGHGFGLAPNRADDVKDWPEKIKLFLDEQN